MRKLILFASISPELEPSQFLEQVVIAIHCAPKIIKNSLCSRRRPTNLSSMAFSDTFDNGDGRGQVYSASSNTQILSSWLRVGSER